MLSARIGAAAFAEGERRATSYNRRVFIGTTLRIEVREEIARFYPDELNRWRNPQWWDNGHWKKVLPEVEWHRVDKFRNQAAKAATPASAGKKKPGGLQGYHFVEVK